jgi:tetratricopeptide (TPR) repeat protein
MGAPAGADEYAEPANPEAARSARAEFATRFAEAAQAHAGSAAAVEAWLAAGDLREEFGDREGATSARRSAVDEAPRGSPLRGLALERLARSYESKGAYAEAGAAHEEASAIESFPLRHLALADAARCFDVAGDRDRAVALADRLEKEAPGAAVPDLLRARLDEIRASRPPPPLR